MITNIARGMIGYTGNIMRIYFQILQDYYCGILEKNANYSPEDLPEEIEIVLPLYGRVKLDRIVTYIITLPIFQRLMSIKQLAHTYTYLIGASHTRFEHSVGVFLLTDNILRALKKKQICIPLGEIGEILIKVAALLHDLGHSGWGHALDGLVGVVLDYCLKDDEFLKKCPIFGAVEKLDTALTTYLLHENSQLRNAISKLLKFLGVQIDADKIIKTLASIIVEEYEPGYDEIRRDTDLLKLVRLGMTIIGAPRGVGGLNLDRVDWVMRDLHHTEAEVILHEKEANNVVLRDALNLLRECVQNIDNILVKCVEVAQHDREVRAHWSSNCIINIENMINTVRRRLYERVYEGFERALMDSILSRLAFSALKLLYLEGRYTSLKILSRVLIGYLLCPDDILKIHTCNILQGALYIPLDKVYGIDEIEVRFLERSAHLAPLLENVFLVIHVLREYRNSNSVRSFTKSFRVPGLECNDYFTIVRIPCSTLALIAEIHKDLWKELEQENLLDVLFICLICGPRRNLFEGFKIPELEDKVNKDLENIGLSKKLGIKEVYILPNYYAFKKLAELYEDNHVENVNQFIELFKQLGELTLLFIIIRSKERIVDDKQEREPREEAVKELVEYLRKYIVSHTANLIHKFKMEIKATLEAS